MRPRHLALALLPALACAKQAPSDPPVTDTTQADGGTPDPIPSGEDDTGTETTTDDPEPPLDDPDPAPELDDPEPPPDAKVQSGKVKLNPFQTKIVVTQGSELSYSYRSHGSVGYDAEFSIGNRRVLDHVRTDMKYAHPNKMKAGMTGADEATGTFVFEAKALGKATLHVTESFRGSPEREVDYDIWVVAP